MLEEHPDAYLLYGCDLQNSYSLTQSGLKRGLTNLQRIVAGIDDRLDALLLSDRVLLHRHVFAEIVLYPQEGACQDPVYNTWMLLHMRRLMLSRPAPPSTPPSARALLRVEELRAGATTALSSQNDDKDTLSVPSSPSLHSASSSGTSGRQLASAGSANDLTLTTNRRPVMMLLKRSANSPHTRNAADLARQWSDAFALRLVADLQRRFEPHFDVQLFSDRDHRLMTCFLCQVERMRNVQVKTMTAS